MSQSSTPSSPPVFTTEAKWTMFGVNVMVLMATLDMSIVNVSLPTLVDRLETTFPVVQWVILSYMLVITSLMLTVSRVGDMWGKRKVFIWGQVLFMAGSLLCGLAPGVHSLIGFRALQGVGAAMSQALGVAIITEAVHPSMRGRAIGLIGATVSVGLSLGPSLGGMIIGSLGWRWIFFINVPVGLFSLWVLLRKVTSGSVPAGKQHFDLPGAFLSFLFMAAYSLAMTWGQGAGFAHPIVLSLFGVAIVGLAAFLIVERKVAEPMLRLKLFANKLLSLNLAMGVLVFVVASSNFILPFFLEYARGYSVQQVGLMIMAIPLSMGLVAPMAGALSDRYGSRWICIVGLAVLIGGCMALGTMHADTGMAGFVLRCIPFGLGMGLFQAPNNSAIMGQAPHDQMGVVSGLLNYSRVIGQTTGLPMIGTLFTAFVLTRVTLVDRTDLAGVDPAVLTEGVTRTYQCLALVVLVVLVLAVWALLVDRKRAGESA